MQYGKYIAKNVAKITFVNSSNKFKIDRFSINKRRFRHWISTMLQNRVFPEREFHFGKDKNMPNYMCHQLLKTIYVT